MLVYARTDAEGEKLSATNRQVVLITGGARGMGRSHALAFAAQGADVAVVDIAAPMASIPYALASPEDLSETAAAIQAAGGRALAIEADVRRQSELDTAVSKTLDEFGHIDTVISSHGVWSWGKFWELDEDAWVDVVDVNLNGVWRIAKAVAPHMMARRSGNLVVVASIAATVPAMNYAHYVSSKAGVAHLARVLAMELGYHNIRVNSVSPGIVDTPMTAMQSVYDRVYPGATREDFVAGGYHMTALAGRTQLRPESVTDAVLWLASDGARDVTGLDLVVDAGSRLLPRYNNDAWLPQSG